MVGQRIVDACHIKMCDHYVGGYFKRDDGDVPAETLQLTVDAQKQGCWQHPIENRNLKGPVLSHMYVFFG